MPSNEMFPHIDPSAEVRRTDRGFVTKSEERRFDALTEGLSEDEKDALIRRRQEKMRAWQESRADES